MHSKILYKFDRAIGHLIPNFNWRAIIYMTLIFALALYVEIWRISPPSGEVDRVAAQKTMDGALKYWNNSGLDSIPPK